MNNKLLGHIINNDIKEFIFVQYIDVIFNLLIFLYLKDTLYKKLKIYISRFKAIRLEVSKKYVLDMDVSVCLEPGQCDLDVSILDQVLIPILNCDLTMDFAVKGTFCRNYLSFKGAFFCQSFILIKI